jgi:hypothetical protein
MRRIIAVMLLVFTGSAANASVAHADVPSNDDIAGATQITSLPFTDSLDTAEATVGATDSRCNIASVWYAFTPTETGRVEVETLGSDFQTSIELLTGDPADPTSIECNWGIRSNLVAEVTAGQTYFVMVGNCCGDETVGPGFVGPGGDLVVTVRTAPPLITTITITAGRPATLTPIGTVFVTGTVTCDQPAGLAITVEVTQRRGGNAARAIGYSFAMCDSTPSPWRATVDSYIEGRFRPGPAEILAGANVYDGPFVYDIYEGPLQLRRGDGSVQDPG